MDGVCVYGSRVTFDIVSAEPEVVAAAAAAADDDDDDDAAAAVDVVAAVVAGCYRVGDNADAGDSQGAVDEVADGLDVVDENANDDKVYRWWWWLWCKYTGNGREPRPLIRALPRRHLLVLLFLPKQVRGPVREIEESEYDGEEDP